VKLVALGLAWFCYSAIQRLCMWSECCTT